MRLTDLVEVTTSESQTEPEDILSSASIIFPDNVHNLHGDSKSTIVYHSKRFGKIELHTSDPSIEADRILFSHYLWNAGIKLAELISTTDSDDPWNVEDQTVIELGAGEFYLFESSKRSTDGKAKGTALSGIIATLAGAQRMTQTVITDYPSQVVLKAILGNASRNISVDLKDRYDVRAHEWGCSDECFAAHQHAFTRILAADCLWMSNEHDNLITSILHFLKPTTASRVLVVAGLHTGRGKVAAFFENAHRRGLIAEIYEEDVDGIRRPWMEERKGSAEDPIERKRWLVIATLRIA